MSTYFQLLRTTVRVSKLTGQPPAYRHMTPIQCFATRARPNARARPPPIELTERAAGRIKELLSQKPDSVGVRLGVKRRGCNGYSYTMNYADQEYVESTKDEVVSEHGVQVLVDPKAIFFLVGATMDYVEDTLSAEFTFSNPNEKGKCGCGESFNV